MSGHRDSRGVVRFLRDCFAWEFGNQSGQNLRAKSLRARSLPAIETALTTVAARPTLPRKARLKLAAQLDQYQRSSDTLYGVFALCRRRAAARGGAGSLCTPLFIGELALDLQAQAPTCLPTSLMVNRSALNAVFDDDTAATVARELNGILERTPLGRAEIEQVIAVLREACPDLQSVGFERFPLLLPDAALETAVANDTLTLVCCATAYVTRRSRQSMGVLHELEQMSGSEPLSAPLRQLMEGASAKAIATDPVFALGALSTPQRNALMAARQHTLSVVHGPPGTGKTHVLTMLILDQLARGQSVLVCARNDAAIDVIERFVCDQLGVREIIVRGGRFRQLSELKQRLMQILKQGFVHFDRPSTALTQACPEQLTPQKWPLRKTLRAARKRLRLLDRAQDKLSRQIERRVDAAAGRSGLAHGLFRLWQRTVGGNETVMSLHKLTNRWVDQLNQRNQAVIEVLQLQLQRRVIAATQSSREALAQLARSFTAREHNQASLQASTDYRQITKPFPLWLCTLADLGQVAPLVPELFDLVIIDEASQADTASALPALQRARRAVIIGDTAQLRHVSFIPRDTEHRFATAHSIQPDSAPGFRDDSILEWTNRRLTTASASSFLDEHFRSAPDIIGFSNREFYHGQLKLLTRSRQAPGTRSISLHFVERGSRGRNDINRREVDAVVAALAQQVERDANAPTPSSLGVLSPFRAQADAIEKAARKVFSVATLERHAVFFGTAHEWQGEERDVVMFSACVDNESASGSLAFLSRPDVLNVAITRARFRQRVFLSRAPERIASDTLFGRYVDWVQTAATQAKTLENSNVSAEPALNEVLAALAPHACDVSTNYAAGSVRVDVLFSLGARHLGLDLIGFPGHAVRAGLGRYELELMQRLAMPVIAVTLRDWQRDRQAVIDTLNAAIAALAGDRS
ncbi:MAG: DEAD/DEAH box helicase [Gammaproteobacteria bacterium]